MIKKTLKTRVQVIEEKGMGVERLIYQKKIEDFFSEFGILTVDEFLWLLFGKQEETDSKRLKKLKEMGAGKEIRKILKMGERLRKEGKL